MDIAFIIMDTNDTALIDTASPIPIRGIETESSRLAISIEVIEELPAIFLHIAPCLSELITALRAIHGLTLYQGEHLPLIILNDDITVPSTLSMPLGGRLLQL